MVLLKVNIGIVVFMRCLFLLISTRIVEEHTNPSQNLINFVKSYKLVCILCLAFVFVAELIQKGVKGKKPLFMFMHTVTSSAGIFPC